MVDNIAQEALQVLSKSKIILLIDWPNPDVPRTLVHKGLIVFCHSPHGYTKAEIVAEYPQDVNQRNVFPPKSNQEGFLVFRILDRPPEHVDIVNIFRPEQEHQEIINDHVLGLGAKCIWLQPPVISARTSAEAHKDNLIFIEGVDIAELAKQLQ